MEFCITNLLRKRRNSLCISIFSQRICGGKGPSKPVDAIARCCPRFLAWFLAAVLCCSSLSVLAANELEIPGMSAFTPAQSPEPLPFTDVPENEYYYSPVQLLYSLGLVYGRSETEFEPNGALTMAESTVLAVRVYEMYYGFQTDFKAPEGSPWYQVYLEKAAEYEILPDGLPNADTNLSRQDALRLLYRMLPTEELSAIRTVDRIPDLSPALPYYGEIHTLYKAGIVCGRDAYGTLDGSSAISRGEYIALLVRLILPDNRVSSELRLASGMRVFSMPKLPMTNPFTDVSDSAWFQRNVVMLQNLGLVAGQTETTFSPYSNVTLGEAAALTVRIYEMYHGLPITLPNGSPWYRSYVDSAVAYGILPSDWTRYNASATREQCAYMIAHTLPIRELGQKNQVTTFKDLDQVTYQTEVLSLYQSGILCGNDEYGTFSGTASISRAEIAAMLVRLILPAKRISFTLTPWHNAKVLIIAGHGMKNGRSLDTGATATVNGVTYLEYEETRKLSELVVDSLSEYADVIYYPSDRDAYTDCKAGVFYSQVDLTDVDYALVIHFNSYNYSANGSVVIIPTQQSSSTIEECIIQNVVNLGFYNRGVVRQNFVVPNAILNKGIPCGLLETCFIDSSSDMRRYTGNRQAIADAIADGIAKGLGLIDG